MLYIFFCCTLLYNIPKIKNRKISKKVLQIF
nr:MAG TPA: hypothetical protein [Caudoviricetes sp.]